MAIDLSQLLVFAPVAIAVTIAPGPDNLMVLSLGLSKGRAAGVAFGAGAGTGCFSHTLLVALGIGALIAASPIAITILRVCGSLYLIWLGVAALRSRSFHWSAPGGSAKKEPLWPLFLKGLFANAINPKVILFFLAFLPQFFDETKGQIPLQAAALGSFFALETIVIFSALGFFSGIVGQWLGRYPKAGLWLDRFAGLVFIGLGISLQADWIASLWA